MTHDRQATVIYNANSGGGDSVGVEDVEQCLRDQGLEPIVHQTESEADLDEILPDARELVITCGGDGTLAAVAKRLAGRSGVEIAHLALGTANNLGHSLGIPPNSIDALADLAARTPQRMDLGSVSQGGRAARFVEGFGCGVYAELLHAYDPGQGKSVMRAVKTLLEVLPSFEPVNVEATVDGHDVSGEYLIFTVMNAKRIGPQLELAPDAGLCDGHFDVVAVKPEGRGSLLAYAQSRMMEEIGAIDGAVHHRGREVQIAPNGFTFHIDTETYDTAEAHEDSDHEIRVAVAEDAVTVLVPDSCA